MLFSLAILLFTSTTVTALTDLQSNCTGTDRLYNGTSCYVIVGNQTKQARAKTSCNHYLGYAGHLVHIRNAGVMAAVKQLMNTYNSSAVDYVWTGLEILNSSAATNDSSNWGYYYRNGTYFSQIYLPWAASEPQANASRSRVYYNRGTDRLHTTTVDQTANIACEYEEALKQPVTDLERKCVNLTRYSTFLTSFVNDVCYILRDIYISYDYAKAACKDIKGYNGHLAHVRTMNELWVADALRPTSSVQWAQLGIEQIDKSSTDPYNGWYLTTPTDSPVPTTFLPWRTKPVAGYRYIILTVGYPNSFATTSNFSNYPYICQYANKTATTTTTLPFSSTTTTKPITATTTTTSTTTATISRAACTTPLTTTAGGTGTTTATTYAERITSSFSHYRFGYFKNTCYWLDQLTVTFSKCLNMCHENELCFGLSYNSGTSDCQLLAIIASASPYWYELTADRQYETVIRELQ